MLGEQQYLNLLENILAEGEIRGDRTGTGTKSIFGASMKYDMREGFPLITTKQVSFNLILKELLFFISGSTDTKILEKQSVNIWKGNTSKDFLEKRSLPYREGDMGPGYGWQWRHSGETYQDYKGFDQLQNVIESIKEDPYGRRHIVSSWDAANIDKMALPPCHCFFQFYVSTDGHLDCQMYQRSADMFLGVPFNIASYALLLHIIANLTNLKPRYFSHVFGDAHIYLNHIEQVQEQLKRIPLIFPTLKINRTLSSIDDLQITDFTLENYHHHPKLVGKMAI
jgi:thymidylate synthase